MSYVKVPCRGRGETPSTSEVNQVIWELYKFISNTSPEDVALIHCTHGFNRTGYVIVNAMMRLCKTGMAVERALRRFSQARPPGIYKDQYIQQLFKYHHEMRPKHIVTPPVPEWKGPGSPDEDEAEADGSQGGEGGVRLHMDDEIGEEVPEEEATWIKEETFMAVAQCQTNEGAMNKRRGVFFPGSQPVSLSRENLDLLNNSRYWVTWKADGTRFLMWITSLGCYLMDRSFKVKRVQMRFPTALKHKPKQPGPAVYPVGPPHDRTLLDGEMVVDEDLEGSQRRRYLVYDMMTINGVNLCDHPFKERYQLVHDQIIVPRQIEKVAIGEGRVAYRYDYGLEDFSVRRKDFWPVFHARKILERFVSGLSHHADGLILQGYEDPYMLGTCPQLLKWKYAHENSVDFQLHFPPEGGYKLRLLVPNGKGRASNNILLKPLDGAVVEFRNGEDMGEYAEKIIECSWDPEHQVWVFMRERKDKTTPNAWFVYEKVYKSIEDNIEEAELLDVFAQVIHLPPYKSDYDRMPKG